jgi:hypothetical protein
MNAGELVAYCRAHRKGKPDGDIREPRVLAEVLTMVLDERLSSLADMAQAASGHVHDTRTGQLVPTIPAKPAPDAKEDSTARALASLIGYLEDLR